MRTLESEYGYKPYPYKHYESIFTRFYQGYLLPRKFGFDKRRVHLGTLVASGQMARQDALDDLERIAYSSAEALEQDKRYFIKKMGWTENQLADYIARPGTSHDTYPTERPLWNFLFVEKEGRTLYKAAKKAYRAVRSTYHRFF
jgi:alkylated DNA repair dioxygenase AlkB